MKLYCIDSNTTLGGHRGLFERLKKNDAPGAHHIFIVPDRYTLGVEKEICETCFENGSFSVDTCSFTRLAVKALGSRVKKCLSKEGTVLLLQRVIAENNDDLVYYKDIRSVGFARELFAAIASLRSSGITPESLREKLPSFEGGLADKLADIALLWEKYIEALSGRYDTVTRVELLRERLEDIPWICESHVYVLGFNVYSELQTSLIKKMLRVCPSVSVAFCKGMGGSNVFCYPSAQRNALIDWCRDNGVPVFYENREEKLTEPFRTLQRDLFGFDKPQDKLTAEEKNRVRVFNAENPYEEVKRACREIRHLVFSEGYRYKDIAVACNDEKYLPVLKTIFARFDIPCFTDEKFSVSMSFAARYIFASLRAVCSEYAAEDVFEVLHSPLSGITYEQARTFIGYCLKYNVSYSRMLSPFAFGDFQEAEEIRGNIIEKLKKVPEDGKKVSDFCDYMLSVLQSETMRKIQEDIPEGSSTALYAYLDTDDLTAVVEEMRTLCGEQTTSAAAFSEMLSSTLEGMSISLLPQYVDCVFIGNTTDSRFSDVKALFVLGATQGNFPVQTSDPLIIGCFDSELMRQNGLPVYPMPVESNLFEKFAVIDLCSKPDRLYVGYSTTGLTGEENKQGEGVDEILSRLFIAEKELDEYHEFSEEEKLLYQLSCPENAYYEYMSGKIPPEYQEAVEGYLRDKGYSTDSAAGDARYKLTSGYKRTDDGYLISVSMLENYFRCPYSHFLSDILKVRRKEDGRMQANDKGNIIHAVLEHFFRNNRNLKEDLDVEKQIKESIDAIFLRTEYDRFRADTLSAYELSQLMKECRKVLLVLIENVRHSEFSPAFLEVRFGGGKELLVTAGGEKFYFRGVADRVDVCGNEVCVIDYKTGSQTDESLDKVYDGEKIQLYVYLRYFIEKGYVPAGVFYLPIRSGYYASGRSYAMIGQMRESLPLYYRLDDRAKAVEDEEKYEGQTVSFRLKRDRNGDVVFADKKSDLLSEGDFTAIADYVFRLTERALADVSEGDNEKNPIKGACNACPYVKICGQREERERPKVTKESFYKGENDG